MNYPAKLRTKTTIVVKQATAFLTIAVFLGFLLPIHFNLYVTKFDSNPQTPNASNPTSDAERMNDPA
jgi:hypothetical protein